MNHGGFPARQLFEKIPASWDWWKNPSEIMLCSHDPWRSFLSTDPRARPQTAAVPRLKAWTIVDSACVAGYNMTWQGSKPAVGDQWAINGFKCDMGIYIMMYFGYI